jgi:hypothetical protein
MLARLQGEFQRLLGQQERIPGATDDSRRRYRSMTAVSKGSERSFGTFSLTTPPSFRASARSCAGIHPLRRALIARRPADRVGLRLRQRVSVSSTLERTTAFMCPRTSTVST